MWPFDSSTQRVNEQVAAALAPGALPSARKQALRALMALPQKPQSLDCYSRIALDPKQVWDTRYVALEGMKLSANAAGVRALLRCVGTDLRRPALHLLCAQGLPEAVRGISAEAAPVLAAALRGMAADAETKQIDLLGSELDSVRTLIAQADTPELHALEPAVAAAAARLAERQVPALLGKALTAQRHDDVKEALAMLERIDSPAARAALEKFRGTKSRLVEKRVMGGIGADKESYLLQVYTSEFGQPKCDEELARDAQWAKETAARYAAKNPRPVAAPPPPPAAEPAADDEELADDFIAASSCGIAEDLLALLKNQWDLLVGLHQAGSLAPLAAAMNAKGEIDGLALTTKDPGAESRTVEGTIDFFREHFRKEAPAGRIVACAVFYHGFHGPGRGSPQVAPARTVDEADCIVARLDHDSGQAVTCVIQYQANPDGSWHYDPPYYALRHPDIFLDRDYLPLLPDRLGTPRFPRRPARRSDHGTHPELMMLLECHLEPLRALLQSNNLEPVGAKLSPAGEIQSVMLVRPDEWAAHRMQTKPADPVVAYPVEQAGQPPAASARFMVRLFRAEAARGEIVASAIFFHASYTTQEAAQLGLMPAGIGEEPNCLVAVLDHRLSQARSVVLRYGRDSRGEWRFAPAEHYSTFPSIFHEGDSSHFDQP